MRLGPYPTPAGGCLLTDPILAERIRKHFAQASIITRADVQLLTLGRHFQLSPHLRLVLGRQDEENQRLLALSQDGDVLLKLLDMPGPWGWSAARWKRKGWPWLRPLSPGTARPGNGRTVEIQYGSKAGDFNGRLCVRPADDNQIGPYRC